MITKLEQTDSLEYSKNRFEKTFDYDKISGNLKIRNRKNGDRFQPLGMSGTKKSRIYSLTKKFQSQIVIIYLFWLMGIIYYG